jgi:hypothetical protein
MHGRRPSNGPEAGIAGSPPARRVPPAQSRAQKAEAESQDLRRRLERDYIWVRSPADVDGFADCLSLIDPNSDVVIDMTDFDNSDGELASVVAYSQARFTATGGSLTISNPSAEVRRILARADLRQVIRRRS